MNTFNSLGGRLRHARREAGLKQKELADKVGASQQMITKLEGQQVANSKYLLKISQALDVPYEWLMFGKDITVKPSIQTVDHDELIKFAVDTLTEVLCSIEKIYNLKGIEPNVDLNLIERAFCTTMRGKLTGDYLTSLLTLLEESSQS